jgi:hypothetical protein
MTQVVPIDWLTAPFAPISLDALNAKAGMMRRIDNKYVVNRLALEDVVSTFAKGFDVLDIQNRRSFTYATRYYDDEKLSSYFEHHQGMRKRMKVRVRRYVEAELCFLEVKVKGTRNMTEKFRMPYDPEALDSLTNKAKDFAQSTYHAQYDKSFRGYLSPSLDMQYQRVTLVSRAGGERMTIDICLHFNAQGQRVSTGSDKFILETKSENGRGLADIILRTAGERPVGRCSKYCIGLAATGQIARCNRFLPTMRMLGLAKPKARTRIPAEMVPHYSKPNAIQLKVV